MSRLVFLTLVALCLADDAELDYSTEQNNATLKALDDNPYLEIIISDGEYPMGIEFLQTIELKTDLMVQVVFDDEDYGPNLENMANTMLHICEILDKEFDEPASSEKRYSVASSLGLEGKRCPIEKGMKSMVPYNFTTEFVTKDLGCGAKSYAMRIHNIDPTTKSKPIMELYVDVKLTQDNETCVENSSSALALSSITASIIFASYVIKFID